MAGISCKSANAWNAHCKPPNCCWLHLEMRRSIWTQRCERLLQIADSSITYRTRHFTTLRPEYVLDLLMEDKANPRSLLFQLDALTGHLDHLPGYAGSAEAPLPQVLAGSALVSVLGASIADLAERDREGNMPALENMAGQLKGNVV